MISEPMIKPMDLSELDGVMVVEHDSFTVPWSRKMFEDELKNQNAHYFVLKTVDHVIGYGGYWRILDEGHITNVAVHSDYRGRGYGKRILAAMIEHAQSLEIHAMTLEVRVSNHPAISLYKSFGFESAGIRKGYYADTHEDAMIMWLHF